MNLEMHQEHHEHKRRNKDKLRLPKSTRNWGKQRISYHAVNDYNILSKDIGNSQNILNIFMRKVFNYLKQYVF
jgi:hypothetical protein